MLQWLEDSQLAASIRQSLWLYPALEIVHITGIILLVGPALLFDFRLLGFTKSIPVAQLERHLLPWARMSLLGLIIPSGFLLFITNAVSLAADPRFWLKMMLLLLAIMNAYIFHRFIFPPVNKDSIVALPVSSKASGIISIALWLGVIVCGRLLAY